MYTLLIVDDEKLAREHIIYKIKNSGICFDWIMEAANAEEAIDIIKSDRPDIMLTDIVMGEKSGLDLLEEANAIAPNMVSMIICGYSDFSYAQRAIQLNAANYLMKPVKEKELKTALLETISEIERRKEMLSLSSENYNLFNKSVSSRIREEASSFINGSKKYSLETILSSLPAESHWHQFIFVRLNWKNSRTDLPEEESDEASRKAMIYGINNLIQEIGGGCLLPTNEQGNILSVFFASDKKSKTEAKRESKELVAEIYNIVKNMLDITLFFGASTLQNAFKYIQTVEAAKALDMRFFTRSSSYWFQDNDFQNIPPTRAADMRALNKFIDSSDVKNTVNMSNTMISAYACGKFTDIRELYTDIVNTVVRSCYRKGVSIIQFLGAESISGYILNAFDTIDEIQESAAAIISSALGYITDGQQTVSDILENARLFIVNNFCSSELCTNLLSKKFCISTGYLSASFKKAYNATISQYIISMRMEHALKLLKTTVAPISDIAESCGFNSLSYFLRVFKSYYGGTPSMFRDNRQ